MKVSSSSVFSEVIIIEPAVYRDERGFFMETYQAQRYSEQGIPVFVQDNLSYSRQRGVLRGLHYQLRQPQGKLISVVQGEIFDVAVDLRRGSPTFGKWVGVVLSETNRRQLYIPEGFAHGFCVTSQQALVSYKCTDFFKREDERGIRWDDPKLRIRWPVSKPVVSDKDRELPVLDQVSEEDLPTCESSEGTARVSS